MLAPFETLSSPSYVGQRWHHKEHDHGEMHHQEHKQDDVLKMSENMCQELSGGEVQVRPKLGPKGLHVDLMIKWPCRADR